MKQKDKNPKGRYLTRKEFLTYLAGTGLAASITAVSCSDSGGDGGSGAQDTYGNSIDGNSDGTGGDPYSFTMQAITVPL